MAHAPAYASNVARAVTSPHLSRHSVPVYAYRIPPGGKVGVVVVVSIPSVQTFPQAPQPCYVAHVDKPWAHRPTQYHRIVGLLRVHKWLVLLISRS
jgi:hypothetical protein